MEGMSFSSMFRSPKDLSSAALRGTVPVTMRSFFMDMLPAKTECIPTKLGSRPHFVLSGS